MTGKLVYKYVTADRIDVLKDGRIRFTQPAALNDPFESLPCLKHFKEDKIRSYQDKAMERFGPLVASQTKQLRETFVDVFLDEFPALNSHFLSFLSVSQTPSNLLMWSHYCHSHSGFVMGFDADSPFFAPGNMSLLGLKAVEYSRKRFVMPTNGFAGMSMDEMAEANVQFLYTKSIDWEYEREMRLLAMPHHADKTLPGPPPIYLFSFPLEAVREVILGFRMQPKMREEIAGLIDEKYPHVALMQAQVNIDDFALDFVPYSQFAKQEQLRSFLRTLCQVEVVFKDNKTTDSTQSLPPRDRKQE